MPTYDWKFKNIGGTGPGSPGPTGPAGPSDLHIVQSTPPSIVGLDEGTLWIDPDMWPSPELLFWWDFYTYGTNYAVDLVGRQDLPVFTGSGGSITYSSSGLLLTNFAYVNQMATDLNNPVDITSFDITFDPWSGTDYLIFELMVNVISGYSYVVDKSYWIAISAAGQLIFGISENNWESHEGETILHSMTPPSAVFNVVWDFYNGRIVVTDNVGVVTTVYTGNVGGPIVSTRTPSFGMGRLSAGTSQYQTADLKVYGYYEYDYS